VVVAVEIVGADDVGDAVEGVVVEEQRPKQRLLRLYRVRRNLEREQLRIGALLTCCLMCECHFFVVDEARDIITRTARLVKTDPVNYL